MDKAALKQERSALSMRFWSQRSCRFIQVTEAVSSLEYAMVVGIIAIAVGSAIATFGDNLKTAIENISDNVGATQTEAIDLDGGG